MNLKKVKIISIIGIFLLSFLFHQLYVWLPNKFFSVFFPVNESIWEHLKMIFTTITFWMIIEYTLLSNIKHNNFTLASLVSNISTIIIFLIIFLPLYNYFGDNLIITLIIYLIAIILGQLISYYILNLTTNYKTLNTISLITIPIILTIFGYLTYNSIKVPLFYDKTNDKYGIYNYYS
jgi:hypothetical protein